MSTGPALVILAAGESARLGQCKALAPVGMKEGRPRNPLELLATAGACFASAPPLVVTGAEHARIAASSPPGVEVLLNPLWRSGRTSGVALAARTRAGLDLCIAPVDVPLVPAAVFEALLAEWKRTGSPRRGWLAPWRRTAEGSGRAYGHPIVAGRSLLGDLEGLGPAAPLSSLRERADPVFSVEVDSEAILDDLDTPADLARLQARSRG